MTNTDRDVNSQERYSLIKEYLESGLSVARWCQDKGYSKSKLYWQLRKRRNNNDNSKSQSVQFISLKAEPKDEQSHIKVKIGRAEIVVSDRFDNSLFREVAKALIALC
jgi:transposase-like protein